MDIAHLASSFDGEVSEKTRKKKNANRWPSEDEFGRSVSWAVGDWFELLVKGMVSLLYCVDWNCRNVAVSLRCPQASVCIADISLRSYGFSELNWGARPGKKPSVNNFHRGRCISYSFAFMLIRPTWTRTRLGKHAPLALRVLRVSRMRVHFAPSFCFHRN